MEAELIDLHYCTVDVEVQVMSALFKGSTGRHNLFSGVHNFQLVCNAESGSTQLIKDFTLRARDPVPRCTLTGSQLIGKETERAGGGDACVFLAK